ncbi:hypothetical protein PMG11_04374 [Penicillium brasilianum]|uniref:Fungal death-pathway protein SesB domain-containing protein n=1 Tax=Penicillium brasilianum TaxID=104259 RepID=A0A0F7VJ39_PENBI|nr:hypothetical protein PMG11_04374 [Penicillium brasilianum]
MTPISFGDNNRGFQVGHNCGSIHAEINLPPERLESLPNPLSTVPFARDPDFVCRNTLLQSIYEKCSIPGSRIALVGLGGVGSDQSHQRYRFFGSTQAIRPGSSKVSGTSQTSSRSQVVRIPKRTYSNWSKTGCGMRTGGNRFVSLII